MPKIVDIDAPENEAFLDLSSAIGRRYDGMFFESLNIISDLDIIFKDTNETPLTSAVRYNYENGVRVICNRLKASGKLASHMVYETDDNTPIHYAAYVGNPEIVKILLANGADPNTYSGRKVDGDTPLMSAIRYLTPYSLLYDGDWGNTVLQEKLKKWFDAKLNIEDLPKGELTVKWSGKLDIIEQLLEAGADPNAKDKFKVSPWSLITTLNDPAHFKRTTFGDGTDKPVYVSGDADHVVFKAQMRRLGRKEIIPVKVIYDVREIRKLLSAYKDKNKNKDSSATSHKVRELSDALHNEVADRKAKQEDLSRDLKATKEKQKPLLQEHKNKAERKKILEGISAVPGLRVFFDMFTKKLYSEISAVSNILTDKVERSHYALGDKAADGIGLLSDLPVVGAIVGGAPKAIGYGVQKASDKREKGKHTHIQKNVPVPAQWSTFCEDIALGVLQQCGPKVSQLNPLRAEKLVTKAVEIAYGILSKNEIAGDVTQVLVDSLLNDDELNKTLRKLFEEQVKANTKNAPVSLTQYSNHKKAATIGTAVAIGVATAVTVAVPAVTDGSDGSKCVVM